MGEQSARTQDYRRRRRLARAASRLFSEYRIASPGLPTIALSSLCRTGSAAPAVEQESGGVCGGLWHLSIRADEARQEVTTRPSRRRYRSTDPAQAPAVSPSCCSHTRTSPG